MYRFIAVSHDPNRPDQVRRVHRIAANLASAAPEWSVVCSRPGLLIAHAGPEQPTPGALELASGRGFVMGSIFRKEADGRSALCSGLSAAESLKIERSGCEHLVQRYWGRYVAFVQGDEPGCVLVLRDATAQMPCYRFAWEGLQLFFSHIDECRRFAPFPVDINWGNLTAYLLTDDDVTRDCGLAGVEDVVGGERLTCSARGIERTTLWNPAAWCDLADGESDAEMAKSMRSAVSDAVATWASVHDRIILTLSGGVDSSIVAGCLAEAETGPEVVCVNHFINLGHKDEHVHVPNLSAENLAKYRRMTGNADERRYARLVGERWRFPLIERERRVEHIALDEVFDAPAAVTPSKFIGAMDLDKAEGAIATEREADAFFTGQGGDTVFYATFQAVGAIDFAWRHGLRRGLMREVANACLLSKESWWHVMGKAIRHGVLRREAKDVYDVLNRPHLLVDDRAASIRESDIRHPWTLAAAGLAPGKRNHVYGLAHSCLLYHLGGGRDRYATSINPLISQPVVEACLRIPTYSLLRGGVSRGLARSAFSDLLPDEIRQRVSKGAGGPFYQRLVRLNIPFIRETLMDGLLVHYHLLDRAKLDRFLVDDQQFRDVMALQILAYVAAEAWLRQWQSAMLTNRTSSDVRVAHAAAY